MDKRKTNGQEVFDEIYKQSTELLIKNIEPKIIHIDSYSYYLLKDMMQRTGQKTSTGFVEIYKIMIGENELIVSIDASTAREGQPKDHPEIISVYGK